MPGLLHLVDADAGAQRWSAILDTRGEKERDAPLASGRARRVTYIRAT
jgi:hypothetical protein